MLRRKNKWVGETKIFLKAKEVSELYLYTAKKCLRLLKLFQLIPRAINLSIASFSLFLSEVVLKNSEAAEKYFLLEDARTSRREKYNQLKERIQKVKSSLASQFGKISSEYKDVVKY